MADLPKRGIDISEFNGNVDIQALKGPVEFVIIRCGYGSDYQNQDDSQFEANVRKCQAAGMPWGVYLYSYAKTTAMAQSEAAHTLRLLAGRTPPYGVWYDVEDSSLPTGSALVDNVVAYCQAIQKAGYYCGWTPMTSGWPSGTPLWIIPVRWAFGSIPTGGCWVEKPLTVTLPTRTTPPLPEERRKTA